MKHFKKPDGSVHAFDADYEGELITADMVAMTPAQVQAHSNPAVPIEQLKSQALVAVRAQRAPILGMLDGMQASALALSNPAKAQAIEVAKQGLKDLTKIDLSACTTADEFKAAVMARYRDIAAALPADVRTAFAAALS